MLKRARPVENPLSIGRSSVHSARYLTPLWDVTLPSWASVHPPGQGTTLNDTGSALRRLIPIRPTGMLEEPSQRICRSRLSRLARTALGRNGEGEQLPGGPDTHFVRCADAAPRVHQPPVQVTRDIVENNWFGDVVGTE